MRRNKERSKQGQTNKQGKATQHTQGSHFSYNNYYKKNEPPRVGLEFEPTTLYTLDSALPLSYIPRLLSWLGPNIYTPLAPVPAINCST